MTGKALLGAFRLHIIIFGADGSALEILSLEKVQEIAKEGTSCEIIWLKK
jgi:hypothetical protein